ncbi:FecCD family ABC transporter permease [Nocardioides abyssi]|uniref:Iron chelate uptake ABC transporter family permease subunit n=1 Tax=Nocardioides abyssi TaxID=3058370 RepID=A0ABT8ETJ7_9ACTN|nr:iron chelate uptake ABC transporter family permease subunit [Nocardioides abyssi]MDN4161475.1 iron chelate uptake ABC transporter family permease subunit [Nocardioides abyssi]
MSPWGARGRTGRGLLALGALAVLLGSCAVALGVGSVDVPVARVLAVVARRAGAGDLDVTLLEDQLVWQLRLPRVLGAVAVGAVLAACGAVLQSLTRNDLADPFLLGVSSGAGVGAVSVIVLGVGVGGLAAGAVLPAAAFAGALAALAAVLLVASAGGGALRPHRTVLAGVAVAHLCGAYTSVVVIMHGQGDAARRVLAWTLGSLAGLRWGSALVLLAAAVVALVWFLAYAERLDAFAFGETSARSLGVPVTATRWVLMVGTALVTATTVAYAGAIGFVGLVVPHLVRPLVGSRHRVLLPASAVAGAVLLVWADTAARSLVEGQEVPIGALTALIGVPVLVWLMARRVAA